MFDQKWGVLFLPAAGLMSGVWTWYTIMPLAVGLLMTAMHSGRASGRIPPVISPTSLHPDSLTQIGQQSPAQIDTAVPSAVNYDDITERTFDIAPRLGN